MAKRKTPKRRKSSLLPESVSTALDTRDAAIDQNDSPFGSPAGVTVDRRIKDVGSARELYIRLVYENRLRAQSFAQIRNQIEGGRPFDPNVIHKNGEDWRCNVNWNDARAAFRRIAAPYWKMVNEVPRKISVRVHSASPEADQWGIALAEAFDRWLDDWGPDYYLQFSGFVDDLLMYGPGFVMWPDDDSPRFKWAQTVQIMFPRRTKTCVDDWELVCLKREMTADQLLKYVKDDNAANDSYRAGWNPDMVKKAIQLAAPQPLQTRFLDPNFWQDMIVSNDLIIGQVWPPISVVDLWAKNRDGKIHHYIFTEKADIGDYLYSSDTGTDSFRRIFGTCFYGVGSNGLLHSIKGFGVLNYYYMTAINRMKCKAVDAVGLTMAMNFTKEDNTPEGVPPVENHSFVNLFPKGLEQLQYYPQIQPAMAMMQSLKQSQDENNFTYSEVKQAIGETDTATQAKLLAGIGAEMESSMAAIFLSQLGGNIFGECFRRLCEESGEDCVKFRKRCEALGVPKEVFSAKIEKTVKTGASPTMASPAMRGQIAQQLMGTVYNLPGANRRWIEEFYVSNLVGAEGVQHALLPVGVDSDPRARREAMMENPDLAQGMPLPVDPSDAHAEHADEHLKPLEMIIGAAQQGQPLTPDHLLALKMTIPHTQAHLQYLAQDNTKTAIFKQLNARLKLVENVARGIETRMARAQRNGATPQETMTQLQAPRQ